jgi:hypothetical protein
MSRSADCREDVRKLKRFADEIELTLDNVETLSGEETWQGPAGDKFRGEWTTHQKSIRDALGAARAEADRMLRRVEEEESQQDTKE